MTDKNFFSALCDPHNSFAHICQRLQKARRPHFLLCLAGTELSDKDGVSAAGSTPEARRLTPAIDAEALLTGRTFSSTTLPVSPRGIVSPVVLTRAALQLCDIDITVVDCGCFVAPKIAHISYRYGPARCPSSGQAQEHRRSEDLFSKGMDLGAKLAGQHDALIIAECVPGGTTTALGLMLALGLSVNGCVSGSLPLLNHQIKSDIVSAGLKAAGYQFEQYRQSPLLAVSAVGDPMQAFAAGAALAASQQIPVMLGGGSQMLAVNALINAICSAKSIDSPSQSILVATTKWVAFDPFARSTELAQMSQSCFGACRPDFQQSRHKGLRAYEEGNVKEGVGAGAAMTIANLRKFAALEILTAIDNQYDQMVLGKHAHMS